MVKESNGYRPEIDGLRAVAIVPVVFFHLMPSKFPNGYLGVDVFFAISGYLITRILLKQFNCGEFSMKDFWLRRIRRLFPVIAMVIIVSMLAGWFILFGDEWVSLSWQSLASVTSTANFYMWRKANNYWGPTAESMPLLHMWSLAVEEQFYLLFPPLLQLTMKKCGLARTREVILAGLVLSFASAVWASFYARSAGFYLLPTRGWELLCGSLLAAASHHGDLGRWDRYKSAGTNLGLAAIALCFVLPVEFVKSGLVLNVFAVLGTCLVIGLADSSSWLVCVLKNRALVFIGLMSYSLYMWHWPLFTLLPLLYKFSPFFLLLITGVVACLSYRCLECTTRFLPPRTFGMVGFSLLGAVLFALTAPFWWSRPDLQFDPPGFPSDMNIEPPYRGFYGEFSGDFRTGLTIGKLSENTRCDILLVGDSHALMYAPVIASIAQDQDLILTSFAADGGTWPFFVASGSDAEEYSAGGWSREDRLAFDVYRREFIQVHSPRCVVIAGRWSFYLTKLGEQVFRQHVDALIQGLPVDANVILVEQPPELPFGSGGFSAGRLSIPWLRTFFELPESKEKREAVAGIFRKQEGFSRKFVFLSIGYLFEGPTGINFLKGRTIFYKDDDHLSERGAFQCEDSFRRVILPYFSKW
jgi:peptidoglycan/LPS O-acetylase OafA/YrhL